MQTVENEIETVHLYVVRENEPKPYTLPPLLCALLCLLGIAALTLYSAQHPYYEHQRLTVPAELLPPKTFRAVAPIIPTGIKTYPATTAHGILTVTNGSVIAQTLPAGLTFISNTGITVITDEAVFVPAGDANGYGWAQVRAHAVESGQRGNLPSYSINSVVGSSIYVRNTSSLSGGRDSYSVTYVRPRDMQTALLQARGILLSKSYGLHYPCVEDQSADRHHMIVAWHCQFIKYTLPPYMHVANVQLLGKQLVLSVWYIPRIQYVRAK
jgi:hypothetical protein